MEVIEKRFKKIQLFSMIISIFSLIIGGLFLGFEEKLNIEIYNVVFGGIIVVAGLFSLIKYFYDGLANDVYKFEIVKGIASIVLGICMIFIKLNNILGTIGIFFGVYYLLDSFIKGFYTFKFLRNNEEIYPLFLMITILFVVMGIFSIFNPFGHFMVITRLISMFLVIGSIFDLMTASLFRKRAKNVLKIFE
jgi:uncharacterized membrane protein HdeD (DUF308 family)